LQQPKNPKSKSNSDIIATPIMTQRISIKAPSKSLFCLSFSHLSPTFWTPNDLDRMAVVSRLKGVWWDPFASRLEKWLRGFAVDLPDETDWKQSVNGSWYEEQVDERGKRKL
jgi:hypothetical protein